MEAVDETRSTKGKVISWENILDTKDEADFQTLLKDMDNLRQVRFTRYICPQGQAIQEAYSDGFWATGHVRHAAL